MKKTIFVSLAFIVVIVVMLYYKSISRLNYMEEVSGIVFPEHELIEYHDNEKTFSRTRLKLDTGRVQTFLSQYAFKPLFPENKKEKIALLQNWFDSSLTNEIPLHHDLYFIDSCTTNKSNRFIYLLDGHSALFWGVVRYSNWGTQRPCE